MDIDLDSVERTDIFPEDAFKDIMSVADNYKPDKNKK
jgi:hypothetical protein